MKPIFLDEIIKKYAEEPEAGIPKTFSIHEVKWLMYNAMKEALLHAALYGKITFTNEGKTIDYSDVLADDGIDVSIDKDSILSIEYEIK